MGKSHNKVVFKDYQQHQQFLIPPSFDGLIDANHPVRLVSRIVDQINIEPILEQYVGGGSSRYHPRMLIKVLIYSYMTNIYSSRKIEAQLKENIHFMWLSGMSTPDHHTVNRFRSDRLKSVVKEIFMQVVHLLAEAGHLSLSRVFVDGTKIHANANRYTFVWAKSLKSNKAKLAKQLEELWEYSQQLAGQEMHQESSPDFAAIDSEQVRQTVMKIDQALQGKPIEATMKTKLSKAKKEWPERMAKYEHQEQLLAGRSSYSKTDPDATFMRMKEDVGEHAQAKPGYNLQMSTNDQMIVNYTIHQCPADTTTLRNHLNEHIRMHAQAPEEVIADAGYGSEENYVILDSLGIEAYVKHNHFDAEHRGKIKPKRTFATEHLHYNATQDYFVCPMGQVMQKVEQKTDKSATDYERSRSAYRAINCNGCPLRGVCHKSIDNRTIVVSVKGMKLRAQASERLQTEKGLAYRKKRGWDVETVFGNLKHNKGFRRFMLRGLDKVWIEIGLLAIAHNLMKIAA